MFLHFDSFDSFDSSAETILEGYGVWRMVRRRIFWCSSRGRERKDVGSWVLLTGFVDASGMGLVTTACSIESPIFVELCRGSVIKRVFKWNDGFSLRLDVRDTR